MSFHVMMAPTRVSVIAISETQKALFLGEAIRKDVHFLALNTRRHIAFGVAETKQTSVETRRKIQHVASFYLNSP